MDHNQVPDKYRPQLNNEDKNSCDLNVFQPKCTLGVDGIQQNGMVNRQVSSSSLCSWSSFDTSLTDDNSSGNDDISNDDSNKTDGLSFKSGGKVSYFNSSIFII